jgi:D-psicose/D-tagatose/L-ribulose 3-epimerase
LGGAAACVARHGPSQRTETLSRAGRAGRRAECFDRKVPGAGTDGTLAAMEDLPNKTPRLMPSLLAAAAAALLAWSPALAAPKPTIGYNTDDLEKAKATGFDYAEVRVRNFTQMSDEDFAKFLEMKKKVGLPTPVGNNFIPADLKLVGPDIDKDKQMEFVRKAFERAQKLGLKVVVLGSGGARKVPEGFSPDEAWKQLVDFAKRIAPEAKKRGVIVAVEPLQKRETNTVNTAAEGLKWVQAVGHPNFQLMVDFYHLSLEKEDPAILVTAKKHSNHIHIANPNGRRFPQSSEEFDYSTFFANLKKINYTGGISIEGGTKDYDNEAPKALTFLRDAAKSGVKAPVNPPPAAAPAAPAAPAPAAAPAPTPPKSAP